jgi:cystathionine gamma-synthase
VIAPRVMYWALRKWLVEFAMPWGLDVEFVDMTDHDALPGAVRPGRTRLVWIETPANPTWELTDIARAAEIAHGVQARLAVDSTVATPVLTRALELGADLVVHSATKYLNGHGDVVAGAIVTAKSDAFWQRIRAWRRDGGAVPGPFEAWLLLRGMRTLHLRVARASATALELARHFHDHPLLGHVLYPGLEDHPGHALAARQMRGGFGGMLSIRHRLGEAGAMATGAAVEVFKRATSLGGTESLIEHRASIEGPSTPVPSDLLRLSVGLESASDLIADLEQALERSSAATPVPAPAAVDGPPGAAKSSVRARIEGVLDDRVRPLVRERGGDLTLLAFEDGCAELAFSGSPGACVAIEGEIANLLRHYVPEVSDVRLASLDTRPETGDGVNPAVAAHGGAIRALRVEGATAYLSMEGACQGCAMADVTMRQGVEILVKRELPEIVAVVDETAHERGERPYFKTRKS